LYGAPYAAIDVVLPEVTADVPSSKDSQERLPAGNLTLTTLNARNFSFLLIAIHNHANGKGLGYSRSRFLVTFWREDRQNIGLSPFPDWLNWLDPQRIP
jgi:hypothetical protein